MNWYQNDINVIFKHKHAVNRHIFEKDGDCSLLNFTLIIINLVDQSTRFVIMSNVGYVRRNISVDCCPRNRKAR